MTTNSKLYVFFIIAYLWLAVFLRNFISVSFWDEIAELSILFLLIINKYKSKEFIFFCFTSFFFIIYSLLYSVNTAYEGVLLDGLQMAKPFIFFYGFSQFAVNFTGHQKRLIRMNIIVLVILTVVSILYDNNIWGGSWFHHPSELACACLNYGLLYWYLSEDGRPSKFVLAIFLLGLYSARSKYYGEFAIFVIVGYLLKEKIVLTQLKYWLFSSLVIAMILYVSWDKINVYFIGGEADGQARYFLYYYIPDVLSKFPILGSGLASYATWFSGVYYSPLYSELGLDSIYGLSSSFYAYIADTWFPCLVEIGIIGIILVIYFYYHRIKEMNTLEMGLHYKLSIIIMAIFIIESVAGAMFVTSDVVIPMFVFANCLNNRKRFAF